MKILSLFIFIFFSLNSQAFLKDLFKSDDLNSSEEIESLKKKVEEKQKLYDRLNKIRNTYSMKVDKKPITDVLTDDPNSFQIDPRELKKFPGAVAYYTFPVAALAWQYRAESKYLKRQADEKPKKMHKKFLRWANAHKMSIGLLFFLITVDRIIAQDINESNEFEALYDKYKNANNTLTEEKIEDMKESLEDPNNYEKMITHYKSYFKELKRFNSFLTRLEKSLKKDKRKLEKLEKSLEASDNL